VGPTLYRPEVGDIAGWIPALPSFGTALNTYKRGVGERDFCEDVPIVGTYPSILLLVAALELAVGAADFKLPHEWRGNLHGSALVN
jgi:hypothetical protein